MLRIMRGRIGAHWTVLRGALATASNSTSGVAANFCQREDCILEMSRSGNLGNTVLLWLPLEGVQTWT